MDFREEFPTLEQINYREEVAEKLKQYPKKPPTTEQAPSTQAILNRPIEDDEKWFNRPISTAGQTTLGMAKNIADVDVAISARDIPAREASVYEYHRRAFKPTLGQSELEGASKESKGKATNAFIYSPSAELTDKEIKNLNYLLGYESTPPGEPEVIKNNWLRDLFFKFFPESKYAYRSYSWLEIQKMREKKED